VSAALLVALVLGLPLGAGAGVRYAKDEALALAFPGGVAKQVTTFLTDEQMEAVRTRAGTAPESKLFTFYEGRRNGELVGYAVIDTHVVRTLPETFLAVLTPDGRIERVVVLAFYEPPEYQPPDRWLKQFEGRSVGPDGWRVGHDVHGISGATLTAHAVTAALRRILALHELVMRPHSAR
jgi:hypothetical protein